LQIVSNLRALALVLPVVAGGCATSSQAAGSRSPQAVVDADDVRRTSSASPRASALPSTTHETASRLPLQLSPRATSAEISEQDLMTRLYLYAADSMLGRKAGELGNVKATDYIARELQRMGVQPMGENGTYFQQVPLVHRGLAKDASLTVDGESLNVGSDVLALTYSDLPGASFGTTMQGSGIEVIFGGTPNRIGITAEQARGKLVVIAPFVAPSGPIPLFWQQQGAFTVDYSALKEAAGVAFMVLDVMPSNILPILTGTTTTLAEDGDGDTPAAGPIALLVSDEAGRKLMGADIGTLRPGATGRTVNANMRISDGATPHPARNVVAVIPGSDPSLRGQYVVIGAHSDHVGTDTALVDHDSLRAFNYVFRPGGADSPPFGAPSPEGMSRVRAKLDSMRALRGPRVDTVFNGADDDGSGSMALLEIAEAMAAAPQKPRRSVLFVWHTAEEDGLLGARWYTANPTVPRDSIVTMLNIDMVGRGGADDHQYGKPGYLQLIGSRRLSTELGDLVEEVSETKGYGVQFNYEFDANGHPQQYYCRSDHYEYAKYGIPVTFFSTGGHVDYHELTDEPQYINYPQLTFVTRFINDVALAVANRDRRPVVDGNVMGPDEPCRQ
jgi:hypothetical protein